MYLDYRILYYIITCNKTPLPMNDEYHFVKLEPWKWCLFCWSRSLFFSQSWIWLPGRKFGASFHLACLLVGTESRGSRALKQRGCRLSVGGLRSMGSPREKRQSERGSCGCVVKSPFLSLGESGIVPASRNISLNLLICLLLFHDNVLHVGI